MSDLASTLTSVTSLLTAASVPSSAVAAVADVVLETEKIAAPFIANNLLHANDAELQNDIAEAVSILNQPDSDDRRAALERYSDQQLQDIGTPIAGGVVGERVITLRVDRLLSYFTAAAKLKRDNKILNDVVTSATKPK